MKVWCKKISKITKWLDVEKVVVGLLVLTTLLSGGILASTRVKADDSATTVVDEVTVVIPAACSMSSTSSSDNIYNIGTVMPDSYTSDIGDTRLKVFCNDFAGFSVYAVGFTNDTIGNNTMSTSATPAQTINTGTATYGNTSAWAMKLTKVTNTSGQADITYGEDNLAITDGTTNYNGVYRTVPATYTKVATYTNNNGPATTDTTLGSNIDARYAVFVSATQTAGTYEGKVKYMLVHPATLTEGTYTIVYNANGGTGAAMSNETGLYNYQEHTLATNTYTAPSGYVFAGWCTVQDTTASGVIQGANPQTTCAGESYADGATLPIFPNGTTAGGTLTLYAYWEKKYIMQEVDEWGDELDEGDEVTAMDSRDGKTYTVAKLADGNIWMTQNLDHNIGDITGGTYTASNTDVSVNWTPHSSEYTKIATAWSGSAVDPESYDPGDVCWNGTLDENWGTNLSSGTTACGSDKHYHIGNYYNWTAAVAMSSSSGYSQSGTDVNRSICPAGWMLPKSGDTLVGSGSFRYLVNQLSLTAGMSGNIQSSPVYFTYGGNWNGGSNYVGSYGIYWSSVVYDSGTAYDLGFNVDDILAPQNFGNRGRGISVRCVAR